MIMVTRRTVMLTRTVMIRTVIVTMLITITMMLTMMIGHDYSDADQDDDGDLLVFCHCSSPGLLPPL